MNRPNIPYNRAPKVCEMIDHLKYLIEQKKLFEDDIIIGIINHSTKKEIEGIFVAYDCDLQRLMILDECKINLG